MNETTVINELKIEVDKLSENGKMLFLWYIGKRLINDYALFSKEVDWGNIYTLKVALEELWLISNSEQSSIYVSNNEQKIESLLEQIESITPDFDEFMDYNILTAFNVCSILFHSLKYCLDKKDDFLNIILDNLIESLKYKVELIILENPMKNVYYSEDDRFLELEKEIFNHSFFCEELTKFYDAILFISVGNLNEMNNIEENEQ